MSTDVEATEVEAEVSGAVGRPHHRLCGVLQLVAFLAYAAAAGELLDLAGGWLDLGGGDVAATYGRSVALGAALLVATGVVPVVAKWALIGRYRAGRLRIWSLAYVRFWIVKTLVVTNPVARLAVGTPLYNLYLRALGADIGAGAVIWSAHVPVCVDLLTVGPRTVIRRDSWFTGYRAIGPDIEVGPVSVGADCSIGEHTVLDPGVGIDDGGHLDHSSSLHTGQVVAAGEVWHGSPAEPSGQPHRAPDPQPRRRATAVRVAAVRATVVKLGLLVAVIGPFEIVASSLSVSHPAVLGGVAEIDSLWIAAAVVFGLTAVGLAVAAAVPRVALTRLQPGRTYRLHGRHHLLLRVGRVCANLRPLPALTGDSVFIVGYLRALGWRLGRVEQTGSNFGMSVRQEVPHLCAAGTGTMVSDGLSMVNVELTSTTFRLVPTTIGARTFVGNDVVYPGGARVGDNCLLATKVGVPTAGPQRSDVGLLGSPCFEIPRTAGRARGAAEVPPGPERDRLLAAKTRHNLVTIALHLVVRWLYVSGVVAVALSGLGDTSGVRGWLGTVLAALADLAFTVGFFAAVERVVVALHPLEPRSCSIYDRAFWDHERYWKVPSTPFQRVFDGTPAKPWVLRLLGVRVGRQVFDDGARIVERQMVAIGSGTVLNAGATLQGHSLEDGAFTSERIRVGAGCTLGTGSFVHYAVDIADGAHIASDAFVMKGSRPAAASRWAGNPARRVGQARP